MRDRESGQVGNQAAINVTFQVFGSLFDKPFLWSQDVGSEHRKFQSVIAYLLSILVLAQNEYYLS